MILYTIDSVANVMEKDRLLLESLDDTPILHFFQFKEKSLTHGYFTKISEQLDISLLKKNQIEFAKRPTGGGIIFHFSDLTFSLLIPKNHKFFSDNTLQNYKTVHQLLLKALGLKNLELKEANTTTSPFCMAKPTIYDLIYNGKKIGGAAQRKTLKGFLHQGSLSLFPQEWPLLEKIISHETILQMKHESSSLFETNSKAIYLQIQQEIETTIKKDCF